MGSVGNSVCYCCVSKGGRVLYTYNNEADHEIENLAALCLEMTPPYHRWYFQTMGNKTFGFLMDDGYVYFTIVHESVRNSGVLRFLQKLRDEFRKLGKRGSLEEQLLPVVHGLIASLEHVGKEWAKENQGGTAVCNNNNANGHMEGGSSTKAPLLGKASKQEKKKMKDDHHVIGMREIGTEENRRSTDRGVKLDSDSNNQGASCASPPRNELNSTRIKASSQKKWCRQVRIVVAVDAAVCIVLLIIWLVICHGIECIR